MIRQSLSLRRRALILLMAMVMVVALLPATAGAKGKQDVSPSCDTRNNNTVAKLLECVTVEGVREHQAAFQAAADANGGVRTSGTPGYDASADYVVERMETAGYDVEVIPFDFDFFQVIGTSTFEQATPTPTSYVDGTDFDVMTFSGSGSTGTVAFTPVDLSLGDPSLSTSGCESSDFTGFPGGTIALMQRGACFFSTKVANAEAAGAVGAVVFNQGTPGREGLFFGTLGGPGFGIPAVSTTFGIGSDLVGGATGSIDATTVSEVRTTVNVIAESTHGDPNNVVMAGGHLDSVPEGPGVQDNGSGSATLIEIAEQMAKVKPVNKVRFAWWGAEEGGLNGSIDYVVNLTQEELDDIAMYFNLDMVGSPNFVRFVYDGDGSDIAPTIAVPPESAVIEQLVLDYFDSQGLETEATVIGARSDHFAFCVSGIPCGGLFTGAEGIKTPAQVEVYGGTAGEQYDPCYHLACDTFDNISLEALDQMSDAAAFTILTFAMNTESLNGTPGKGNFKPQNQLKALR